MAAGQVPPLDGATLDAVAAAISAAMRNGITPAEELNNRGLIITRARKEILAIAGMEKFRNLLALWLPHEMLRKANKKSENATPADMFLAMVMFVDEFITDLKERGL